MKVLQLLIILPLLIISVYCGSRSKINLAEFIWKHLRVLVAEMYAIDCVPLGILTVCYLNHYRAASNGWTSDILCDVCTEEFNLVLPRFVDNCNYERSCKCNMCLRQLLSLRGLASHTLFSLTFNLSEFILTSVTIYHQYFL